MTREVTREQLQSYDGMLNAVATEAESEFRAAMAAKAEALGDFSEWSDAEKSEFRDYAAEQMRTLGLAFGDASASTAQTFCDTALDGELDVALFEEGCITSESAEKSARYWAGSLYGDDPSAQRFIDGCAAKVNRNVSHAADLRVANAAVAANGGGGGTGGGGSHGGANGGRKPVKFARVPVGPTCPFCIMLASRGFVYATAKTAGELGQYHDRCNCRILAGYEGMQVEGYDYEGMYKRYLMCRKTIGDSQQTWKDWKGLSDEERGDMKFSEYNTKRILHEMATRDRQWLFDGTLPEIRYYKARSEFAIEDEEGGIVEKFKDWRDLFAHDALSANGFKINVRVENAPRGYSNIDLDINGKLWEIKSPDGESERQIRRAFGKAHRQFERQYKTSFPVRLIINGKYSARNDDWIEAEIRKCAARRSEVAEALFINKRGEIVRVR